MKFQKILPLIKMENIILLYMIEEEHLFVKITIYQNKKIKK